jgi:hypothetical protein
MAINRASIAKELQTELLKKKFCSQALALHLLKVKALQLLTMKQVKVTLLVM